LRKAVCNINSEQYEEEKNSLLKNGHEENNLAICFGAARLIDD
jgi:hypothetical protein